VEGVRREGMQEEGYGWAIHEAYSARGKGLIGGHIRVI